MTYDPMDTEMVLMLARAGGCSLASSPGDRDNWVERAGKGGRGGKLPNYICKIAKGVMKSGKSKSQAIAIAVAQVKKWASGVGDVNADTRAKAARAVAQWEALKAKNKAKRVVKATHTDGTPYLALAQKDVPEYDLDLVRDAWRAYARRIEEEAHGKARDGGTEATPSVPYMWIRSMWSTFIIVETDSGVLLKIPYEVIGQDVHFGAAVAVKQVFVEDPNWDDEWTDSVVFDDDDDEEDEELTEDERRLLNLVLGD